MHRYVVIVKRTRIMLNTNKCSFSVPFSIRKHWIRVLVDTHFPNVGTGRKFGICIIYLNGHVIKCIFWHFWCALQYWDIHYALCLSPENATRSTTQSNSISTGKIRFLLTFYTLFKSFPSWLDCTQFNENCWISIVEWFGGVIWNRGIWLRKLNDSLFLH